MSDAVHSRKKIRDAVVKALLDADTSASDRVFSGRSTSLKDVQRPNIVVYTRPEESKPAAQTPKPLRRELTLTIEGRIEGKESENLDDLMDALAFEIEKVMDADPSFSRTARVSYLASTNLDTESASESLTGQLTLTYKVTYIF